MKSQRKDKSMLDGQEDLFKYDEITYLRDYKINSNFSFLQSIILISSFLAGSNKESTDTKLFEMDRSKRGMHNANRNQNNVKNGVTLFGKTKRFGIDRLISIVDYLISLEIEGSNETLLVQHSNEFYACINTLVKEDLLKKTVTK